jgi:hypothetical protein
MTDAGSLVLHTGAHAGIWGAVEVAFAVGVLLISVGLVARLLLAAREGTPEARLAEALPGDGSPDQETPSAGGSPLDRRRD